MRRFLIILVSTIAFNANAATQILGPYDAGRVKEELQKQDLNKVPESKSGIPSAEKERISTVPANAEEIKFILHSLKISGVEVISKEEIKNLYKEKIGTEISLLDIYQIADEITNLYNKKGFVLTRAIVPQQEIENGDVKIKVVEGKIAHVILDGEVPNKDFLASAITKLELKKAMNIYELEERLLLLNDLAGVKFKTVLQPTGNEGLVDLIIVPEEVKYENQAYFNNYGSKFVGPNQGTLRLGYNHSFLLPFNQTEFTFITTSRTSELKYYDINHSIPLNTTGSKVSLRATNSEVQPGYTQKKSKIDGKSKTYEANFSQSIIRSRLQNLNANLTLTFKENNTTVLASPFVREKLRILKLNTTYDIRDNFNGISIFDATISKGLKYFQASKRNSSLLSRSKGRPDFLTLRGSLSRYQMLPGEFSLLMVLNGQYSKAPLLSSEQFGYGGPSFGRAYDSSEVLGDKGYVGMAEIRYDGTPKLMDIQIQPFVYYDLGRVWNISAIPKHVKASSWGGGLKIEHSIGLFGVFTVAQPMEKHQSNPLYTKKTNTPRYGFQIGLKF